jgi:hypothetical protein
VPPSVQVSGPAASVTPGSSAGKPSSEVHFGSSVERMFASNQAAQLAGGPAASETARQAWESTAAT